MLNKKLFYAATILVAFLFLSTVSNINAYYIITPPTNIVFNLGESFNIQDVYTGLNLTFLVTSGSLQGSAAITLDNFGGNITIIPSANGIITVNTNGYAGALMLFVDDGVYLSGAYFFSGDTCVISWIYTSPSTSPTPTPGVPYPNTINTDYLWQYLNNYDFIGFIIACWTVSLGESFYVIIGLIGSLAVYIRMKNLIVLCVIWILLGSFYVALIPVASPIIYLFFALGIAGLLFKVLGESKY